MRAISIDQPGGPEVMRLEEVELPSLAKGEVRLRQHAIGINFVDIYQRSGLYPTARLPFTPGNEGAGEVVEVGPGVTRVKTGDKVAITFTTDESAALTISAARSDGAKPEKPGASRPKLAGKIAAVDATASASATSSRMESARSYSVLPVSVSDSRRDVRLSSRAPSDSSSSFT